MEAEEERKQREKQEQEEAERIKKSQKETLESINRVHEHFVNVVTQKVTASSSNEPEKQDASKSDVISNQHIRGSQFGKQNLDSFGVSRAPTLSQMRGRKRKRQLSPEIVRPFRNKNLKKKGSTDNSNKKNRR